jgi:hypothetical protein
MPRGAPAQVDWQEEIESLRRAYDEQQRLIERQGQHLAAQQTRLEELEQSRRNSQFDPQVNGGGVDYSGGFVLAGPVDVETTEPQFQMRIGTWGQFRHNFLDSNGPNQGQNDFDLERLRLVFNGHAFSSNFQYFFQFDGDSDAAEVVDVLDYYITYDFGRDLFCWDKGRLRLRLGRWKIGFNRAREESGTRMQFSDRSTASVLFDFDRSLGVGLLGEIGEFDWQVALGNGIDTGGIRTTRLGLDRNFALATRLNCHVCGDWGNDGHPDLDWRTAPAVRLGTGFTYSRRDMEGILEFAFPRVVDSGALITTVLPADVTAYNQYMYAADLNVKFRGFSLIYEYYVRQFSRFSGDAVSNLLDHGYWAEVGYFIVPERVQLIARHARIVGNSGTLGNVDQSSDEVAAGFVIYARRHNLKLTFDVTRLNGAPVNDSALSIRPGDAGWLYRTQFQWKF